MPSAIRIRKIEDRIRDELAEMFLYEIEDPRLSGVMVTGVKVDRELEYASSTKIGRASCRERV